MIDPTDEVVDPTLPTEPIDDIDAGLEQDVYLASPYDDNDPEVDTDDGTEAP
jgi:hypothetical protein